MDNGKLIDVEIMQRYCKPCQQHKGKLTPHDFDVWYEGHKQNCVANYEVSAPMMEVVGAKRIFERSITSRKLRSIIQCRKWLMQFGPVFCMLLATKNTNTTLFTTTRGVSTAETRLIILIYLNMDQVFQMK